MKALVFKDRLALDNSYPQPKPQSGEALVRVKQAGICSTDLEIVKGYMGFSGVLGHEFVGIVAEGSDRLNGKRVVAEINCVCGRCSLCQSGLSNHCRRRTVVGIAGRDGCFAESLTVPEANLHQLPDAVSDDQAVFVEPLAAAYQVIKQVKIEPRMQVTVLGAGRLGLLIAQVLRTTGCRLQVVARSEKSLHFLDRKGIQSISVDQVAPKLDQDVVVEASGSADGFNLATKLVRPRGTLVLKSTYAGPAQLDMAPIVVNEVTVLGSRCGPFTDAIQALARQEIDVESLISRRLPLDRGIEAMQLAADSANIKVLLRMDS